jgi:hypothetical protein
VDEIADAPRFPETSPGCTPNPTDTMEMSWRAGKTINLLNIGLHFPKAEKRLNTNDMRNM